MTLREQLRRWWNRPRESWTGPALESLDTPPPKTVQQVRAEQAAPCPHGSIRIGYDDVVRCGECGTEVPDPRGCRHLRIDNRTARCVECGEKMARRQQEFDTVRSAPNLAACTIPDCDGGPGCENPDGLYVPDVARERTVLVPGPITYTCERCWDGQDVVFSPEGTLWPCGGDHRGEDVSTASRSAS